MSREEDLKQELQEIEALKEKESIEEQLKSMTLVGKCYASHKLNRYMTNKPSYSFTVVKITGKQHIDRSYKPFVYTGLSIHVFKNGKTFLVSRSELQDNEPSLWKYEITNEQFDTVDKLFIPGIEAHIDDLRNAFVSQDWVSQGDHDKCNKKCIYLDNLGIDYIDFKDNDGKFHGSNLTIMEIISWNNHPFVFNGKLYKVQGWMDIVKKIRDEMQSDASSWGGGIYQRDAPRIKMLNDFIKKYDK